MSIFAEGEEVICVDVSNIEDKHRDKLKLGKTYVVLHQGVWCNCCIDVGIGAWCFEGRFRRPETTDVQTFIIDKVKS